MQRWNKRVELASDKVIEAGTKSAEEYKEAMENETAAFKAYTEIQASCPTKDLLQMLARSASPVVIVL